MNKVTGWDTPKTSGGGDKAPRQTATVRYTYMLDPAPWASDAAVQGAFPVLARVVRGSGTMELTQQLVATGGGWQPMRTGEMRRENQALTTRRAKRSR